MLIHALREESRMKCEELAEKEQRLWERLREEQIQRQVPRNDSKRGIFKVMSLG